MLRDAYGFKDVWLPTRRDATKNSLGAFVAFIERRLGARLEYDARDFPYGAYELTDLFDTLARMRDAGVVREYARTYPLPDEPQITSWSVTYRDGEDPSAGGSTLDDERGALIRAIAEAQERYLWALTHDWAKGLHDIRLKDAGPTYIDPRSVAGFTVHQRESQRLRLEEETLFTYVQAQNHLSGTHRYVPLQMVTAHNPPRQGTAEPLIRPRITTGLATHPDRLQALLSGGLEIIERDAYMITWLNQITPPQIPRTSLIGRSQSLDRLLEMCVRYRLTPHFVRFPTDAPAFALGCVIFDDLGLATVGISANRDLTLASEKALLEGLRARGSLRRDAPDVEPQTIGHKNRVKYWATPARSSMLSFLVTGSEARLDEPWQHDSPMEHWQRILTWCKERGYTCLSVPLTQSHKNVTGWHVECVVMPDLQPMHLNEKYPAIGGRRLREIPMLFGYTPREPYVAEPHPFA